MKEDLWKSFAMKHGYDRRDDSPRRDAVRRERLRRVVDDIAYALYRGKMATAARVSRPHVAGANRAWLSAEFIPARQTTKMPPPPPSTQGGWHTARRSRSPPPGARQARSSSPPPSSTAMDSQSNDEFFARYTS